MTQTDLTIVRQDLETSTQNDGINIRKTGDIVTLDYTDENSQNKNLEQELRV